MGDAYASSLERIQRHDRIWEVEGTVGAGATSVNNINVGEGGIADGLFAFNWNDASERLGVEIRRPDGTLVTDGVAGARVFSDDTHYTARVGTVAPGTWTVTLRGTIGSPDYIGKLSGKNQQGAQLSLFFGQYHGDPGLLFQRGRFLRGLPMPILASLNDRNRPSSARTSWRTIEHPDGWTLQTAAAG